MTASPIWWMAHGQAFGLNGDFINHRESPMKFVITAVIALASTFAFAHGGGTDSSGCHTNSKTGSYHCH